MAAKPLLTVLIPTRGRAERLAQCLGSAISTSKGWPLHFVIGFDDDPESYIIHQELSREKPAPNVDVTCILLKPRHYYVRAINALYRYAKRFGLDYFLLSNDDVTFAPNWAAQAVRGLQRSFPNGEGICELAGPDLCAHYVSRATFISAEFEGLLGEPCYTFYFSDKEMMMRAQNLGRYRYLTGPSGPLLHHEVREDKVRGECDRWFTLDEAQYYRRRVQQEWPDGSVPRHIFKEVFKGDDTKSAS